ncbi:MAG: L-seryl-tRNA(Sec) selenium transferase [Phycisphaerales bacterium]|nr:L-seryl-tRNA(Sec) selenium transferase [Phycisphaerales bacterium]MCB9854399.1 L-seryl-tRNA(Sec) selenium transferase [Phycisphaerales bacterium]MCB9863600.1 L-seryl-tRNA(Sec) selenium transferase [Phycisphaerales bacterium]
MERHDSIDLSQIPSMTALLTAASTHATLQHAHRSTLTPIFRSLLERMRDLARAGELDASQFEPAFLLEQAKSQLESRQMARLRRVINATGIVLHTGLGRSPLSTAAIERINDVAGGYSNLELDLASGERGLRGGYAESLLQELTGAEAALVVNNNAAATLLALCTLAGGREVIVSRGQLIEIGGSYRLPDVMQAGGARLREVGTTNKTRVGDYERAIGDATSLIMRVHTSNYRVVGFSETPDTRELAELAHRHGLLMYDDLGSGALVDDALWIEANEPSVPEALRDGADLVSFSGDKLLGGPQAGILLGSRSVIDRLRANPMARALRVGKLTLAALEATLECYRDPAKARQSIPLLSALHESTESLKARAERLAKSVSIAVPNIDASVSMEQSYAGGGSLPAWPMPTACVRCTLPNGVSVDRVARKLRTGEPSVLCRIREDTIILDARTIRDTELSGVVEAIVDAVAE